MEMILNSVFRNMTITDVNDLLELYKDSDFDFWDLIELYQIAK